LIGCLRFLLHALVWKRPWKRQGWTSAESSVYEPGAAT
jgi:hypothetical protein